VGTPGNDHIVVQQQNNRISVEGTVINVHGQGPKSSVRASAVKEINVRGLAGNDYIQIGAASGPGAIYKPTTISGGPGNDYILGGQGDDRIHGDAGNDVIYGRGGNDVLYGDAGNDLLDGGTGNDRLRGGTGNDQLLGGDGADNLDGGAGKNALTGGGGNDVIRASGSGDTANGGGGYDVAFLQHTAASSAGNWLAAVYGVESLHKPTGFRAVTLVSQDPFRQQEDRLISMINAYRTSHGLAPLTVDSRLTEAASYQAKYMARTGDYSHTNLDGRTLADRVRAAGYPFSWAGENIHLYDPTVRRTMGIDRVYQPSELAQYYLDGWKVSPEHNAILLSREPINIGVAMASDSAGRVYVSMVVGRPW
jgi:uncharacterized protein YkwD